MGAFVVNPSQKACKSIVRSLFVSSATNSYAAHTRLFRLIKGSLWDFRLQVFFMNQGPPGPQVLHWIQFEFFQKFAEIFAN